MKEIGGYFGLEELMKNHYYQDAIPLNTGRNALAYLIEAKNIQKVYLPYYLCDSVLEVCIKLNVSYEFYLITRDFIPKFNRTLNEGEYLYIVNFYGQLKEDVIVSFANKYKRIILDNTQSFFQPPYPNVDTIYSCRKYFGVADGAFLFTDVELNRKLDIDSSKDRMEHVLGRYEGVAHEYYEPYKNNELSLAEEPLMQMSKITYNIMGAINYNKILKIRNNNYLTLESHLIDYNMLLLSKPSGPYAYPLYLENGAEIKKELAKKYKIYIPTLWPEVTQKMPKESLEYQYAVNILPIPCDQRYGEDDMRYIISKIIDNISPKTI